MGRRRTGTAWEKPRGSGAWLAAITLTDGTRTTRPVPPRKSGAPVDAAYARAYAREWQRQCDEGEWAPAAQGVAAAVHTVGSWATAWAAGLTSKTAVNDRWVIRRMLGRDPIAAVALRSLTSADVVGLIARLRALPSRQGGTLAPRSVRGYLEVTHRAIAAAVSAGHLAADPWERLPPGAIPAPRDKTPGARRLWRYSADEIALLIGDPRVPLDRRVRWTMAFATGARGSELCAIRWEEWEREARPLSRVVFARGLVGRARSQVEDETKTGAVKEVPAHPVLAAALASWWSTGWAATSGRSPTLEDRIFARADGAPLDVHRMWRHLQADCAAVGIRPRRLHGTRHTTIRQAREGGADRESVKTLTHAPAVSSDAFGGYDAPSWERLCEAVMALDLRAPGSDSAPDSATTFFVDPMNLDGIVRSDLLIKQDAASLPAGKPQDAPRESSSAPTAGGDSAPDSAPTVAVRGAGERAALAWCDRVLAMDLAAEWAGGDA